MSIEMKKKQFKYAQRLRFERDFAMSELSKKMETIKTLQRRMAVLAQNQMPTVSDVVRLSGKTGKNRKNRKNRQSGKNRTGRSGRFELYKKR